MVVLVVTCRSEVWVLREREMCRLQATEIRVLRRVAAVWSLGCLRNEESRHRLQWRSIALTYYVYVVRERKENWRLVGVDK